MFFFKPNISKMRKNLDIDGLIGALTHKDPKIRNRAVSALGELGDERAVEPLIQCLDDSRVHAQAVNALAHFGNDAINPLLNALDNPKIFIRKGAATSLGIIGDEQAVEPLIQLMKDNKGGPRKEAVAALGEIGGRKAITTLIQQMNSKALPDLVAALARIGGPAVSPLIKALDDENQYRSGGAATALGMIGDHKSIDGLISALQNEHSGTRIAAAIALGNLGVERAENNLRKLAEQDKNMGVKQSAGQALQKIWAERGRRQASGMRY